MSQLDTVTREQLWKDPDWNCPHCGWTNLAIRSACRNFYCNFRWEDEAIAMVIGDDGLAREWRP